MAVDEAEVIAVSTRSHTGGRYWDELVISINPRLETDLTGSYRLLDDHENVLPKNILVIKDDEGIFAVPEYVAFVKKWATARLANVKGHLRLIFEGRDTVRVSRVMFVSEEWLSQLGDPTDLTFPVSQFGYFWSGEDGAPDAYFGAKSGDIEILIEGEVGPEAIDYRTTLLARMDYMNADQEAEIRLLPDARVTVRNLTVYGRDPLASADAQDSSIPAPAGRV